MSFYKFHNYLGHKTLQCIIFRDLVQNPLKEGSLKFVDKPNPQEEGNSDSKVEKALYVEAVKVIMVEIMDNNNVYMFKVNSLDYIEQVKLVYPKSEEVLINFLNRCELKYSEVMLCLHCSAIFDKEVAKGLEEFTKWKSGSTNKKDNFTFDKTGIPRRTPHGITYIPSTNVLVREWVRHVEKTGVDQRKWKMVDIDARSSYHDNYQTSKKYSYTSKNYLGENPMIMTQWRRH